VSPRPSLSPVRLEQELRLINNKKDRPVIKKMLGMAE